MRTVRTGLHRAFVVSCLLAGCTTSHMPEESGPGADGGSFDSLPAPDGWNPCRFLPDADHRYVGSGGGSLCGFQTCPAMYQSMVASGVAYGGCGGYSLPESELCFDVCIPASQVATRSDGTDVSLREGWAAFCCGNGPACRCDEVCWAPDPTQAPTCVPR